VVSRWVIDLDSRWRQGSIERVEQDKYKVSGVLDKVDDHTVEITELPIRKWTQDFKEMLEELTTGTDKTPSTVKVRLTAGISCWCQDYEEHHTDTTVHFKVHMTEKDMKAAETEGFEKKFKMTTTLGTGNMVCFDLNGKIKRYSSAEEILTDFFHKRLEFYGLRKVSILVFYFDRGWCSQQHLADELNKQFEKLSNQARFVQMVITRELVVSNKKKVDIVAELRDLKFRPFPKGKKSDVEAEPSMEEDDEGLASDYDYLLGMAIWSLTAEKVGICGWCLSWRQVEKLLAERDVKEQELIELLKLSPQDLWNHDLDNFLAEWDVSLSMWCSLTPAPPRGRCQRFEVGQAQDQSSHQGSSQEEAQGERRWLGRVGWLCPYKKGGRGKAESQSGHSVPGQGVPSEAS
jgi:DNA topoisomerase-2